MSAPTAQCIRSMRELDTGAAGPASRVVVSAGTARGIGAGRRDEIARYTAIGGVAE